MRSARTGDDGGYLAEIPTGTYHATVTAFGFEPASVDITVTAGETTDTDIALTGVEGFTVSGRVLDQDTGGRHPVTPRSPSPAPGSPPPPTPTAASPSSTCPGPADYLLSVDGGGCTRPVTAP